MPCRFCNAGPRYKVVAEVGWRLCHFHAMSAVNCGFKVYDLIHREVVSVDEALEAHRRTKEQTDGR